MNEKSESEQSLTDKAVLWNIRRAVKWSRDLRQAQFRFKGLQWENRIPTAEADFETLRIEFKKVNG